MIPRIARAVLSSNAVEPVSGVLIGVPKKVMRFPDGKKVASERLYELVRRHSTGEKRSLKITAEVVTNSISVFKPVPVRFHEMKPNPRLGTGTLG